MNRTTLDFTLERDKFQQIVFVWNDGRRISGVDPVRAFPISEPAGFVSICGPDGGLLARIDNLDDLPSDVRKILENELALREFVPVVLRIESVSAENDPSQWNVITDRGPTTFLMEESDNDVRRLGPHRVLLVDSHGIRYLIPDTRRLNAAGRRILDRYLL